MKRHMVLGLILYSLLTMESNGQSPQAYYQDTSLNEVILEASRETSIKFTTTTSVVIETKTGEIYFGNIPGVDSLYVYFRKSPKKDTLFIKTNSVNAIQMGNKVVHSPGGQSIEFQLRNKIVKATGLEKYFILKNQDIKAKLKQGNDYFFDAISGKILDSEADSMIMKNNFGRMHKLHLNEISYFRSKFLQVPLGFYNSYPIVLKYADGVNGEFRSGQFVSLKLKTGTSVKGPILISVDGQVKVGSNVIEVTDIRSIEKLTLLGYNNRNAAWGGVLIAGKAMILVCSVGLTYLAALFGPVGGLFAAVIAGNIALAKSVDNGKSNLRTVKWQFKFLNCPPDLIVDKY